MAGNYPPLPASGANGPTIISHQQPRHPGMILAPPVDQRAKQEKAERVRGGCCLCPGGGVWVVSTGKNDDDAAEVAQRPQQMAEAKASQSTAPAQPLPVLQLSSSGPAPQPRTSNPTKPTPSLRSGSHQPEPRQLPPSNPTGRTTSLPPRPQPAHLPRQTRGGRTQSMMTRPPPNLR